MSDRWCIKCSECGKPLEAPDREVQLAARVQLLEDTLRQIRDAPGPRAYLLAGHGACAWAGRFHALQKLASEPFAR